MVATVVMTAEIWIAGLPARRPNDTRGNRCPLRPGGGSPWPNRAATVQAKTRSADPAISPSSASTRGPGQPGP